MYIKTLLKWVNSRNAYNTSKNTVCSRNYFLIKQNLFIIKIEDKNRCIQLNRYI